MHKYSIPVLRIGLAFVMLWFGVSQLAHAANWYAFLPEWTNSLPLSQAAFIHLNGLFEITAGMLLALGFFYKDRFSPSCHSSLGYRDIPWRKSDSHPRLWTDGIPCYAISVWAERIFT